MLDRLVDSSQRNAPSEGGRVRRLVETSERRLWIAPEPPIGPPTLSCLHGNGLNGSSLISAPVRRLSLWVASVVRSG